MPCQVAGGAREQLREIADGIEGEGGRSRDRRGLEHVAELAAGKAGDRGRGDRRHRDGARNADRCAPAITVAAIWMIERTSGICISERMALPMPWKKFDSHEKPLGSVKASGSLPT